MFAKQLEMLACIPDGSGTDPGTTEQATEDVDNRQDDNVQVEAVTLLILHKQGVYTQEKKSKEHLAFLLSLEPIPTLKFMLFIA